MHSVVLFISSCEKNAAISYVHVHVASISRQKEGPARADNFERARQKLITTSTCFAYFYVLT